MRYTVVKDFKDLRDNGHVYRAGEAFPRPSVNVDDERIRELSTEENARGQILIRAVPEPEPEQKPEKKRRRRNVRADTENN